ncbi:Rossmann-like domain-containing protein [Thermodesulfobacteriota bacterium]
MMILEDIIASLGHDSKIKDIRQGVFHTGVLTRNCGLAATLPRDALKQPPPLVKYPGTLLDLSALELADTAFSESILEAAIGMAAINSLIDIDESRCSELNARELIIEKGMDRNIVIIGHFPFIPKLKEIARELWVIEKNPKPGDHPEESARDLIPEADVLAITGTAITNHSIEDLLKLKKVSAFTIVLGDSAVLSPVLFDYGVDAVAGTKVIDNELALRCVSQGANFRQVKGIKKLIMIK